MLMMMIILHRIRGPPPESQMNMIHQHKAAFFSYFRCLSVKFNERKSVQHSLSLSYSHTNCMFMSMNGNLCVCLQMCVEEQQYLSRCFCSFSVFLCALNYLLTSVFGVTWWTTYNHNGEKTMPFELQQCFHILTCSPSISTIWNILRTHSHSHNIQH